MLKKFKRALVTVLCSAMILSDSYVINAAGTDTVSSSDIICSVSDGDMDQYSSVSGDSIIDTENLLTDTASGNDTEEITDSEEVTVSYSDTLFEQNAETVVGKQPALYSEAEIIDIVRGLASTDVENASIAKANKTYTVSILEIGECRFFSYSTDRPGVLTIQSTGTVNPYCEVYEASNLESNVAYSSTLASSENNFYLSLNVQAGKTYYIKTGISGEHTGSYKVKFSFQQFMEIKSASITKKPAVSTFYRGITTYSIFDQPITVTIKSPDNKKQAVSSDSTLWSSYGFKTSLTDSLGDTVAVYDINDEAAKEALYDIPAGKYKLSVYIPQTEKNLTTTIKVVEPETTSKSLKLGKPIKGLPSSGLTSNVIKVTIPENSGYVITANAQSMTLYNSSVDPVCECYNGYMTAELSHGTYYLAVINSYKTDVALYTTSAIEKVELASGSKKLVRYYGINDNALFGIKLKVTYKNGTVKTVNAYSSDWDAMDIQILPSLYKDGKVMYADGTGYYPVGTYDYKLNVSGYGTVYVPVTIKSRDKISKTLSKSSKISVAASFSNGLPTSNYYTYYKVKVSNAGKHQINSSKSTINMSLFDTKGSAVKHGIYSGDIYNFNKPGIYYIRVAAKSKTTISLKNLTPVYKYTVKFKGGEGTSGKMASKSYESGREYTLPACKFKKSGCEFLYWVDENGTKFFPDQPYMNMKSSKGTMTLTAVWAEATSE